MNFEFRVDVLHQVAQQIETISDRTQQVNVTASTAILAGLVLDKMMIKRLLREEIMKESVIYQEIQAISEAKGRAEGEVLGIQKGEANLVIRQLHRRFGEIPLTLMEKIRELSVEQLESLGESLLDFESQADLVGWLNQDQP